MTAADHLATARLYARVADEEWAHGELEAARTAAEIGRLHLDIHRELWLAEVNLPPTDLGVVTPVIDLPTYQDKKKAPATPTQPAEAHDTNPHQED